MRQAQADPVHVGGVMVAALHVWFTLGAARALAAEIEDPSMASAAAVFGTELRGPNYEIANAVRSDGFDQRADAANILVAHPGCWLVKQQ